MRLFSIAPLCGAVFVCLGMIVLAEVQTPSTEEGDGVAGMVPQLGGQGGAPDGIKQRDPFWPVGYIPKIVKINQASKVGKSSMVVAFTPEQARALLWDEARKKVDIKGISLIHDKISGSPKYLALVAGKLVEEGNVISVKYDGRLYRWKVAGISEEGVSLQKLDARGE